MGRLGQVRWKYMKSPMNTQKLKNPSPNINIANTFCRGIFDTFTT